MKAQLSQFILLIFVAMTGCTIPLGGSETAIKYYMLNNGTASSGPVAAKNLRLLVREAFSSSFIDSHKVIYSKEPTSRATYQFAQWVEPPPARITTLVIQQLEASRLFASVNREDSTVIGDIQMNLELVEFYHDLANSPSRVVITLVVEIIDNKTRSMISKKTFHIEQESDGNEAEDAVAAFNIGLQMFLDQLIRWLADSSLAIERD